jgi:hypothetical protein
MRKLVRISWIVALGALPLACTSINSPQGTLEAVQEGVASHFGPKLFVEGFIEFTGPQRRWSGPATLTVQVSAREPGPPQVRVTPELPVTIGPQPLNPAPTARTRGLASATGLTAEQARDRLARLAAALATGETSFAGCDAPVRVRLVRQDGAIVEQQGCRGLSGWPREAGDLVATLLQDHWGSRPDASPATSVVEPPHSAEAKAHAALGEAGPSIE